MYRQKRILRMKLKKRKDSFPKECISSIMSAKQFLEAANGHYLSEL